VDRRRFRPTAAVNLLLGGVPAIRVMERLGHSKLTMLHQHYATMSPPDWGVCRNLTDYLKVSKVRIAGYTCEDNHWDCYVLLLMAQEAKRRSIGEFRELAIKHINKTSEALVSDVADL
jgi:hypothetical protein